MRVVSMGELLIDFVALESGVTVGEASGFQKAPGGAPANVAVAIKRLGLESAFITQVGDDPFGHYLSGVLADEDIDVSGIRFSQEARTMLAFVSLAQGGERSFNFYRHPSADMLLTSDDIALDVIDSADLFHFGSITLITNPARDATLHAASYAREQGKLVSYDPNLRLALWDNDDAARKGMRLGLEYANIVKISDEEAYLVLEDGEDVKDLFDKFEQIELIMLTRGENGCTVYLRDSSEYSHKGYKVTSVDTTGAGDSFMAGIIVGVLEGLDDNRDFSTIDFESVLKLANASGALATTGRGAIPSLPTRAEVDAFIQSVS
ncbi:MAG: PfkB family carbohydrate kinase [Chloroflexota bacterium]